MNKVYEGVNSDPLVTSAIEIPCSLKAIATRLQISTDPFE